MNLTTLKIFLRRNDVRIIIICTLSGGILQVISKQYLKRHPEFLRDVPVTEKKYKPPRLPRFFSNRGGAMIEISGVSIKIIAKVTLNFLAKKGLLAGVITGGVIVIGKIPPTAVSTYLRDSFPQNLPDLEKKKFILVGEEKIYLDQCDESLKYLFNILEDETIPFEKREKIAQSVLTKYLNPKTPFGRRNTVLCIIFIIYILFTERHSSFYLMMKSLIEAVRKGRISKQMARLIIRRLRKKGIPIDPELAEIVAY